jgi:FlaG/FlaF family flagellin (archaellin)
MAWLLWIVGFLMIVAITFGLAAWVYDKVLCEIFKGIWK